LRRTVSCRPDDATAAGSTADYSPLKVSSPMLPPDFMASVSAFVDSLSSSQITAVPVAAGIDIGA
jgi:hypothetical protein